tara:strand:+ start:473 stop:805 length:333 start_codon:yes stop_codon:yes gene_type:complete
MGRRRSAAHSKKLANGYSRRYGVRRHSEELPKEPELVVEESRSKPEPEPVVERQPEPEPVVEPEPEVSPAVVVSEKQQSPLDVAKKLVKKTRSRKKAAPKLKEKVELEDK